jgi:ribosome-binding factor A
MTDGLNHGSIAECVAALEQEVERLRRLVDQRTQVRIVPTVVPLKRRAG